MKDSDLEHRLNSGNSVVISHVFSRLVESITEKFRDNKSEESKEIKFLLEKAIICRDDAVNVVSSASLLHLVKQGVLSPRILLDDIVSIIATNKFSANSSAYLINNLLLQIYSLDKHNGSSNFNLQMPKHPFITMLHEDPNSWHSIFQEINNTYRECDDTENDTITCLYHNQVYKPLFLYIIGDPNLEVLTPLKQKLWTLITNYNYHQEHLMSLTNDSEKSCDLLTCLLSWMNFQSRSTLQVNAELLIELCEFSIEKNVFDPDLLLLWQASALYYLVLHNLDPRSMISSMKYVVQSHDDLVVLQPVLFILTKTVFICSSVHLVQVLKLGKLIVTHSITQQRGTSIINETLKSSLLYWISNPSLLNTDSIKCAHEIFALLESNSYRKRQKTPGKPLQNFSRKFSTLLNTNIEAYIALELCQQSSEQWKNEQDLKQWLGKLRRSPSFFLVKIVPFLYGILLSEVSPENHLMALDLTMKCTEFNSTISSYSLSVILYVLSTTTCSDLHLKLMRALPKLAVLKENLPMILSTLQALNCGFGPLKLFSTTFLFELWKIEDKNTYPHLEKLLASPYDLKSGSKWEFYVTRAYILKEICCLKPQVYGTDMVAHLSKILNECNNPDGAIACALAVDGITALCKFEVIDAVTTWATLEPMLKNDFRIPVIQCLCSMISEIPRLPYAESYPELLDKVVTKLWHYTTSNAQKEIWDASLSALTCFDLDLVVAKMPDHYLSEELLQMRESGQNLPGQVWISFLKNCTGVTLDSARDFLIKLVTLEVGSYLKFVYQVKGAREPVDYSILPQTSVVRALTAYLKPNVQRWDTSPHKEVFLICLRVLSSSEYHAKFNKPLPPLDWCFLQEMFHHPDTRDLCLDLACHQVVLSGSARRLVVNYIEALTQNASEGDVVDVVRVYKNLKYLANSVQPFTLKPFLEVTMARAVYLIKQRDGDSNGVALFHYLRDTLGDPKVQDSNKGVIAEIITSIFASEASCQDSNSSELFDHLRKCIAAFPPNILDTVTSPKCVQWPNDGDRKKEETTEKWFRNAIKIKCHVALETTHGSALSHLNELIEVGSHFPKAAPEAFLQFVVVFTHHKDKSENALWLLDLIGQIQVYLGEKSDKEIVFLCDVFMLACVTFSGHSFSEESEDDGLDEIKRLFPRSVATLFDVDHWSICTNQALELFHHMCSRDYLNNYPGYKAIFKECLRALKHEAEFRKSFKWMKYVNIECID